MKYVDYLNFINDQLIKNQRLISNKIILNTFNYNTYYFLIEIIIIKKCLMIL